MSVEDQHIKQIENGIRALRLKTKTPQEINVSKSFTALKSLNEGMHDDLMEKYKRVLKDYKNT